MDTIRHLEPVRFNISRNLKMDYEYENFQLNPDTPVIVPGDRHKEHVKKVDEEGGIRYLQNQLQTCEKLANDLGVNPLKFLEQ